ncbi:hypothetical protein ARMSODRAFT_1022399 [Armillaria solidipes]|uniref:Uncharacterized protein n=1 Tax=Armillaria solidipes TaxID=1076256 RepID=A0A2H3B6H2_9AGAR|nr:hypothetical protein ARMSODRAFT_1022399 [Armillaria solidipes]
MTNQGNGNAPASGVDGLTDLFRSVSLTPAQAHALVNAVLTASSSPSAAPAASSSTAPAVTPAAAPVVVPVPAPVVPPVAAPAALAAPVQGALAGGPGTPFPPPGPVRAGQGFYVVPATVPGPYYVITRGQRVGVFADWSVVAPWVIHVHTSAYHRVGSIREGVQCMHEAVKDDSACVLP